MKLSLKKLLAGTIIAAILVIGARFGLLGALVAVVLVLQMAAVGSFIDLLNSPVGQEPHVPPRQSPLQEPPNSRTNGTQAVSARIALRERAHLNHGDYRRLRALCEGEPHLLQLMGLGGGTPSGGNGQ